MAKKSKLERTDDAINKLRALILQMQKKVEALKPDLPDYMYSSAEASLGLMLTDWDGYANMWITQTSTEDQ